MGITTSFTTAMFMMRTRTYTMVMSRKRNFQPGNH
jgi:hypothetical protein